MPADMTSNQSLQPTAFWRCASMSILISVFLADAMPAPRAVAKFILVRCRSLYL